MFYFDSPWKAEKNSGLAPGVLCLNFGVTPNGVYFIPDSKTLNLFNEETRSLYRPWWSASVSSLNANATVTSPAAAARRVRSAILVKERICQLVPVSNN